MKLSLITTVLDEEKSILPLLQSIELQTRQPDEVVIVDAGSTDQTVQLIKVWKKQSNLKIRLLHKLGNRAVGRNYALREAVGQGIAVTDAGCVLNKNWFARITAPLVAKKADVVAGFYRMKTDTLFAQCSALFLGIMSHNVDKNNFLPSSRSIAFTRAAWEQVGGYPERLDYAEDLIFARKLKPKMIFEPGAWVWWTPPQSLQEFFTAVRHYTRGNIQARYWPHLSKNILVALRYLFLPVTILLLPLYFLYVTIKFRRYLHHPLAPNLLFVLQLTADLAVMAGLVQGVYDSVVSSRPRRSRN